MLVTYKYLSATGQLAFSTVNIGSYDWDTAPGSTMYADVADFFGLARSDFSLVCTDGGEDEEGRGHIADTDAMHTCGSAKLLPNRALKVLGERARQLAAAQQSVPQPIRRGASASKPRVSSSPRLRRLEELLSAYQAAPAGRKEEALRRLVAARATHARLAAEDAKYRAAVSARRKAAAASKIEAAAAAASNVQAAADLFAGMSMGGRSPRRRCSPRQLLRTPRRRTPR
jgi:hypothetical protein